ncbi:MAG: hypothetical protein IH991_20535, partial [Planctomycetes bacterium]|nr:hypothetical protein [Planctomycetota bacterium]
TKTGSTGPQHVGALIAQLQRRGYAVERVAIPFQPQARSSVLAQAAAWRLLDLSVSNEQSIDLLIATRFPSYFARHPRKVRALFGDGVYIEGWGTFCERLMLDLGWGGPLDRLAHHPDYPVGNNWLALRDELLFEAFG